MAKERSFLLVGLDIGTSKTAVVIAEYVNGRPELKGSGVSPSAGLEEGVIADTGAAAGAIKQAMDAAEQMAGVKASLAYAGYSWANVTVKAAADVTPDEKVLQLIPPRFLPEWHGYGAEFNARAVAAGIRDVNNIIESARIAGLSVQNVIYGPLAIAEAVLSPAEREFGTLLVDIGAGSTKVSIIDRSAIRETAVLPVGGGHLSADLAIGLRTSLARAGEVLDNFSLDGTSGSREIYELPGEKEGDVKKVSRTMIRSIIEARIAEILDLVAMAVKRFDYPGLLPGGAVFCGGVSRLSGLALLAENKLQMPVRIGQTETTGPVSGPAYANALGLVKCGCKHLREKGPELKSRRARRSVFLGRFLGRPGAG
ncbi:MAG: hypothetical protein HPY89_02765 [Pelotomaculum sp.]|uniref:Actin-like ATPase n=1 Tax=Pelotomaculum thermopropionicum (strain DSM 13744 / JCM 10971 / SI) TaxID=370438 RepID=A5D135_PELTS|nr:hypothetical protein [Pelotomaculum sp.]BAF60032.1 actin-like ATPase [Pelotomaculum thermopropionicum SI]